MRSLLLVTTTSLGFYAGISFYKNDEKFYRNIVMPLVHQIDPERAHRLGIFINRNRLIPENKYRDPAALKITLFGREFENPVGIAAGYDKNGEAILGLRDLGFGFIEIGSVTPEPQEGNPKPRVFRLKNDRAVINRYGFNNDGHDLVYDRICQLRADSDSGKNLILGVNLGKNKNSPDAVQDYVRGVQKFGPVADYLVINVSSPNTPGLRTMQHKEALTDLLTGVNRALAQLSLSKPPPLLLKLAPDLTDRELSDIAQVIGKKNSKVDGLIVSNTTIERPPCLTSDSAKGETGGLSGHPLKGQSTRMISDVYRLTGGRVPIVGVGGVFTGQDAYEKIKAGASVIQVYTSLVYEGPPVVARIKRELAELLEKDGVSRIEDAIGRESLSK